MTDRPTHRLLLVCATLAVLVAAGCLGSAEDPTGLDGSDGAANGTDDAVETPENGSATNATDGSGTGEDADATGNGSADTDGADGDDADDGDGGSLTDGAGASGNETRPAGAPPSIDEADAERAVLSEVTEYRAQAGFVELRRTRTLAVGSAESTNRDLAARGTAAPYDGTGEDLNLSSERLLERFRGEGADVCTGRSGDVAGLMSSVRDVTDIDGVTAAGEGTSYADAIADDVVTTWTRDETTREVMRGGYRFIGVDALYEPSRGLVYVTTAVC